MRMFNTILFIRTKYYESTFPAPRRKKETGKYILLYIIKFFETTKIMLCINITCYGGTAYKF